MAIGCYLTDEACPKQDEQAFPPFLLPCFLPASPCPQKDHKQACVSVLHKQIKLHQRYGAMCNQCHFVTETPPEGPEHWLPT